MRCDGWWWWERKQIFWMHFGWVSEERSSRMIMKTCFFFFSCSNVAHHWRIWFTFFSPPPALDDPSIVLHVMKQRMCSELIFFPKIWNLFVRIAGLMMMMMMKEFSFNFHYNFDTRNAQFRDGSFRKPWEGFVVKKKVKMKRDRDYDKILKKWHRFLSRLAYQELFEKLSISNHEVWHFFPLSCLLLHQCSLTIWRDIFLSIYLLSKNIYRCQN